jgi:hypothetical protein
VCGDYTINFPPKAASSVTRLTMLSVCIFSALVIVSGAVIKTCDPSSCYNPSGSVLNATDFSLWLQAHAGSSLSVVPGTYALAAPAAGSPAHLVLPPVSDTVLSFTGVTLVAASRKAGGVYLNSWVNSSLAGLIFRYAEPPSSSAAIVGLNTSARYFDVVIEPGHPIDDYVAGTVSSCNAFESSNRLRRPLASDIYVSSVASLDNGVFRLTVSNVGQMAGVLVGDLLGCRVPDGGMTFHADQASGCNFSDITLFGGPCFGYFETGGGSNSWSDISITYPEPPTGGAASPLLSTSADGFHSSGTRVGPRITRASFEGMDDDGIAIHGNIRLVTDVSGSQIWTVNLGPAAIGDRFIIYDQTFQAIPFLSEGSNFAATFLTVTAVAAADPDYRPPFNVSKTMPSQTLPASYQVLTVTPAPPAGAAFDWVIINADAVGRGFAVRDSYIRNHRARGLLIKGSDGFIDNVTITNSSLGGIIITPELYWREAGYARNITVMNCAITLTSSGVQSYGGIALGAVAPGGQLVTGLGHADIVIQDNSIVDAGYAPVWLNAAANVTFQRNRIITPFHAANASYLPHCCLPVPQNLSCVYAIANAALTIVDNCVDRAPGTVAFSLMNVTNSSGRFDGGVVDGCPSVKASVPL